MKCPRCGEPEHPDQCTVEAHPFKRLNKIGLPSVDWFKRKIAADSDVECEAGQRFFIDHGMIHDKVTGRHVTTAPDSEPWNGMTITETCNLLNKLNG